MPKTFVLWTTVLRWVDGDTYAGFIDQGFNDFLGSIGNPVRCRLALINAPEIRTDAGVAALRYAEQIAKPGEYQCISYKPDEYGRPLVDLALGDGRMFSEAMIQAGHAVVYRR